MLRTTEILAVARVVVMGLVLGMAGVASAEAVLWLKADTISGLSNGATVNSWADSSSFGNDASRTLGSPTYQTGVINGKPVVRFDGNVHGSHDELQVPDHASLDLPQYTLFVVALQSTTEYDVMLAKGGLPTSTGWNYLVAPSNNRFQSGANAQGKTPAGNVDSVSTAGINSTFGILSAWADTTIAYLGVGDDASSLYLNGTDVSLNPAAAGDITTDFTTNEPLFIGGGGSPSPVEGGQPFTGDIAELAILPFAATEQEILDVNAYLGAKYGITVEGGGNAGAGEQLLIPEPASLALLFIGLPFVMRRKRR